MVSHLALLRLNPQRLKLGQYLFLRHGGKVVFFGRFIAVLRAVAALMAGINRMAWGRFLFFNAAGSVVWASAYGVGAYAFGEALTNALSDVGMVLAALAAVLVVAGLQFVRKYERQLEDVAERALPGPLPGVRSKGPGDRKWHLEG